MNAEGTQVDHEASPSEHEEGAREAQGSSAPGRPFTSESAREAAKKGAEARRAKQAQREADADLDALALSQRLSTVLAGKLPAERLRKVMEGLIEKAEKGDVAAHRALMGWVKLAVGDDEPEPPEGGAWQDMTPQRRAALRARVAAMLEEAGGVPDHVPDSASEQGDRGGEAEILPPAA